MVAAVTFLQNLRTQKYSFIKNAAAFTSSRIRVLFNYISEFI